jgi:hypothetical protein
MIYSTKGSGIVYVLGLYRSDRHNLMIRRIRQQIPKQSHLKDKRRNAWGG